MLPLSLDLTRLNLVLIGNGKACLRRLRLLDEAGAHSLAVFSANPSPALAQEAGRHLRRHWPKRDELRGVQLAFIADVPEPQRTALVGLARSIGAILHVEDAPVRSDIYMPADHAAVRRLTAAQMGRYGWRKQHPVAVAANDRGTEIREPNGGGVS